MAVNASSWAAIHRSELYRQLIRVQVRKVHKSLISSPDSAGSGKERFKLSHSELVVVLFNRKSHTSMIAQESSNVVQG